jgi:eukaryotic-like serine/threonine-protein kinase
MTPERWSRISAIFDAALELAPRRRSAFIAQECGEDAGLRAEVERLLAEDERTKGLLDEPVLPPSAASREPNGGSASPETETSPIGRLIQGRFAIRARLGGGGMGEVFLAEDTKLKKRVALKRLRPEIRSDERYRMRLLQEARRASAVNDPHIAQVYDVLEEGDETFLVMEYVEGVTLRRRIGSPLPVAEFLEIAIQCAAALAAAHRQGVVHCDIKPENIMLTPADQVKILDFGVAKRLPFYDSRGTTLSVELEGLFGTPAYMAPEVLAGQAPEARSDLYSLGVTFHEALVGRRPDLPALPMAAAPGDPGAAVPQELGLIVTKMLQPDPAQRYSDAADLLRDLRCLQDSGRDESNRPSALIIAGALFLTLFAWLAVTQLWPLLSRWVHPVPKEKQVAVLPFSVAGADADSKAFADGLNAVLSAKLTQLTKRPQFQVVPVSEVRARHVATATDARKEFGVNLVIEGTWQQAGGKVHVVPVLIDATSNRQLRADEFVAASSDPIGLEEQVASGVLQMLELELQSAEQKSFKAGDSVEPDAYAHYLRGRGYLEEFDKPENIDSAIAEFDRALERNASYSPALAGLGEAYWRKYEATSDRQWTLLAKMDCERAVGLAEAQSSGHACLGQVLLGTGEYEQAAAQYQRAVELEPTSDESVAGLASAYSDLGKTQEAEATFRKAIALRPNYWLAYNALGRFYYEHGRYDEAANMFNKVVSIAPDSFRGYSNLGGAEVQAGRYEEGIQWLQRSISIRPTYVAYSNLATAFFELRRFDDAAHACTQALQQDDRDYVVWANLANAYYYGGNRRGAAAAFDKAISLAKERLVVNPRDASVLGDLASYYSMLGQENLALKSVKRALQLAPNDPYVLFEAAMVYSDSHSDLKLRFLGDALRHGLPLSLVANAPAFDGLRDRPGFKSLLEEYGKRDQKNRAKTPSG